MASRAESPSSVALPALPPEPRLGSAIRAALSDFYYNSLRFVAANLIWRRASSSCGSVSSPRPRSSLLAPLLAFPTASIFRIAVLVHRGELASFWDGLAVWRTDAGPILLLGVAIAGCMAVFLVNLWFGILMATPIGWSLATLAAWGLLVTWLFAWTAWPVLMDPRRASRPIRDRLRVAGLLVIAFPVRLACSACSSPSSWLRARSRSSCSRRSGYLSPRSLQRGTSFRPPTGWSSDWARRRYRRVPGPAGPAVHRPLRRCNHVRHSCDDLQAHRVT